MSQFFLQKSQFRQEKVDRIRRILATIFRSHESSFDKYRSLPCKVDTVVDSFLIQYAFMRSYIFVVFCFSRLIRIRIKEMYSFTVGIRCRKWRKMRIFCRWWKKELKFFKSSFSLSHVRVLQIQRFVHIEFLFYRKFLSDLNKISRYFKFFKCTIESKLRLEIWRKILFHV